MSDDNLYGPPLPPDFDSPGVKGPKVDEDEYGPSLPPGMRPEEEDSEEDEGSYGPALPPGLKKKQERISEESDDEDSFGPPLPPELLVKQKKGKWEDISEDEEDVIGPMPPSASENVYAKSSAEEFEERARAMKDKLTGKNVSSAPSREAWMTDLPEYSKAFGITPRSFRKTNRPENDDRSVWTDTPADTERKAREKQEKLARELSKPSKKPEISERDKRIANQVSSYNSSQRGESLVDMHSKKRKLEETEEPSERIPFNRETDLQVNRFDDAKRKNLIKKSAELDTRFSHGKEKVFL